MNRIELNITSSPESCAQQLFELERSVFTRPFDLPSRSLAEFNSFLSKSTFIIARNNESIVGFLAFDIENQLSVELKLIAIDKQFQGKGYGTQLLQTLTQLYPQSTVHLTVHPDNIQGVNFYVGNGFHVIKRSENYYGDGQPRLLLALNR